ncbi:hypothetical protein BURPSS13_I0373 [Burkholderia pseudomallei S13]|nr:hypothetical protein BURPSS13_I0373 [Burkholderia pseudomallei S13]
MRGPRAPARIAAARHAPAMRANLSRRGATAVRGALKEA